VIGILHHIVTMETLEVTTYNMHSFQSGLSCLTDLCDSGVCDTGVQEHWLATYNKTNCKSSILILTVYAGVLWLRNSNQVY